MRVPFPSLSSAGCVLALTLVVPALAGPLAGQMPARAQAVSVQWWHAAVAVGGVATLMLVDEPVARFMQDRRSNGTNDVASVVRHMGNYPFYISAAAGTVAVGLVSGDSRITRAGGRLAAALALTGTLTRLGKFGAGRERPIPSGLDSDQYHPFSTGYTSLPSGHTSMAFALATSLSDEIERPWATVALYTGAGLVGWSRLNDNRHWLSDVAAGAMIGIFSAKLVNGRWRVFNLRPPGVKAGSQGIEVAWNVAF